MRRDIVTEIVVCLLILLFAYTATSKLINHNQFVVQMEISPLPLIRMFALDFGWFIPIIELTLVFFLLIARLRLYGLYGSLILLSIFELYIMGMLLSGYHLPCSCGGIIGTMSWRAHLVFNATFIFLASVVIWHYKTSHFSTDDSSK